MESLKIIPEIFFDLIARVVPGGVGLVAYLLLSGKSWQSWLDTTLGSSLAGSPSVAILIFLVAAYLVGQLLSAAAKLVQRIGEGLPNWIEKKFPKLVERLKIKYTDGKKPDEKNPPLRETTPTLVKLIVCKPLKAEGYDWLRLHYPGIGDQCAKIRAEFTMHNGLAVVLLLTAIAYPLRVEGWRWYVLIGLVLVGLVEFYRGRTTRDTFNQTVKKFRKAADQPPPRIRDVASNACFGVSHDKAGNVIETHELTGDFKE